ncbi:hypothetical protein HBH98_184760 [Parastagonospora nodorum]|nr:hypothetical protein HBH52_024840 [Parastagonospora nodorum]KAH3997612.1 hypothetical protein HBI10_143520 [Parastagonospora nodorum]KAH4021120.1 hypothetical protein HBI13_111820 [Parastagonospora nodorum]KAH4037096.1 hypothetical protein HBI09_065850 [Parastagonospora nodorum]KAH4057778.1 hypothetical protein HBH50_234910 [Parastagonospora nodorum]
MSYRGRPSKGCDGCRARKVKCDEATPKCSRCARSNQECRYRDRTDILFRNQTDIAAQRAEDSWRRRSKSFLDASGESSTTRRLAAGGHQRNSPENQQARSNDSGSSVSPSTSHGPGHTYFDNVRVASPLGRSKLPIPTSPRQDLRHLAYQRFVYDFVVFPDPNKPLEEPSDALFSFVPLLYENAHPQSCLVTVVNAVAYINFANRRDVPQAMALAEESFGEGIKMLSRMIANEETAASDEALCSVHLMGIFETLTKFQRQGSFAAHQHGANALLQLRTIENYYRSPISARLYEVAYAQMLLASLQAATIPPIPVQDLPSVRMYLPSFCTGSGIFVIGLIWKSAQLHAMWHETKRSVPQPSNRLELQETLQLALDLDAEFQVWESELPPPWKYVMEPNSPDAQIKYSSKWQRLVLTSRGAPTEIHTYTTLKICSMWGYYRTSRMFLLRDLLEMLSWMSRLPETEPRTSLTRTWRRLKYRLPDTEQFADESTVTALDDTTTRLLRSSITRSIIQTIEETCSSILGTLTVPVYGKSPEDVMGMKGHVIVWPLSTMDAILSSGLVLDSNGFARSSATPQSSSTGALSGQGSTAAGQAGNAFYHDTSLATAAHGFSSLPSITRSPEPYDSTQAPPSAPHVPVTSERQPHPFDSMPIHPNDRPVDQIGIIASETMDITAKREWLNSMLYYIGTELGIKKAMAVPVLEGYMSIIQTRVNIILGR